MKNFAIIVAIDEKMGIGKGNSLPWRLSKDMQRFKEITQSAPEGKQNAVIMGRKTWESLPAKYRPLPGRLNVVLSSKPDIGLPAGVLSAASFDHALRSLEVREDVAGIFIIGGGIVFEQAIRHKECAKLYLTRITGDFSCDVFFPPITPFFKPVVISKEYKENDISFHFCDFEKE